MKIKNQPKERLMLSWVYMLHLILDSFLMNLAYFIFISSHAWEVDLRAQALKEPWKPSGGCVVWELEAANPVCKFPCLVICFCSCTSGFYSCGDVAVDCSETLLAENNKLMIFKVVGFLTGIFSCTVKLIGEMCMNCSLTPDRVVTKHLLMLLCWNVLPSKLWA